MSTDEKIKEFDLCFKKHGGHFNLSKSPKHEYLESFLKLGRNNIELLRNINSKLPEAYLDFIFNPSINACATKTPDGNYYIGINFGTVVILHHLFKRMLASKSLFPEIGNPLIEKETRKIYNAQITDANTLFLVVDPNENFTPVDESRLVLSEYLTAFAIEFLAMHEYAHVIFGHVDYLNSKSQTFYWNEAVESKKCLIDPLISQTLEMDADCYGVSLGMQKVVGIVNSHNSNPLPFSSSLDSCLAMWLFSVYSLFRIFGFKNVSIESIKETCHPLTGIRQHLIGATVIAYFETTNQIDFASKVAKISADVHFQVEKAFEEISEQGYDVSALSAGYHQKSLEHSHLLVEHWNAVRPELEKFAYGNLAPMHINPVNPK